jgi:5'-methylthioadenosine phosphorylase
MYDLPGMTDVKRVTLSTPFGAPSDAFVTGTLNGTRVVFLARHGAGHRILPQELNARANIYGFKMFGVKWLISVSACGSLQEKYRPGDLAVPSGLFDRTSGRAGTFFGDGCVAHISLADPFCPVLRRVLTEQCTAACAAANNGKRVHDGGSVVSINGPRFSTRTESNVFRQWGLDLINMTTVPEAQLAAEAEIAYAVVNHVTDYDCWKVDEQHVTVAEVVKTMMGNVEAVKASVAGTIGALAAIKEDSPRWSGLKDALFTRPELVPRTTRAKLQLLTQKYWAAEHFA